MISITEIQSQANEFPIRKFCGFLTGKLLFDMEKARLDQDPIRLFIQEWMAVREIPNQKVLAERMGRSASVITKKLKDQSKIDLQWLSEFSSALRVQPTDLFRDPSEFSEIPPEHDPLLAKLMLVGSKLTQAELQHLISFLARGETSQPPAQPGYEDQRAHPSTTKST